MVGIILDVEKELPKFKQHHFHLKINREGSLGNFWAENTRHKIPWTWKTWTLHFSGFYKIGLTNFRNNKNVAPFWIQIHFELGLLFLNVEKEIWKDDNHCHDIWNGYANHEVELRWPVSRTIQTPSQKHHIEHPWSQSNLAPIPRQNKIITWNDIHIHHDKLQVQHRKKKIHGVW